MKKMPVIFVGHGSPINIIEDNAFTKGWANMATDIPKPKAILCISAHWFSESTSVSSVKKPQTIHDFYGFPNELYAINYQSPGACETAVQIQERLQNMKIPINVDQNRGLDHGCWSVLKFMYPKADISVCQLSVNKNFTPRQCYDLGQELKYLRDEGVLILASGNIVHNLALVDYRLENGYDWANQFDEEIKKLILNAEHENVIQFQNITSFTNKVFYSLDHYYPLLYALGATEKNEKVRVYNNTRVMGSISMTSYIIGD